MIKIGITGIRSSGKSTLLKIMKDSGAATFSCDEIIREMQKPSGIIWKRIRAEYGDRFIDEDGTIRRGALAEYILSDPSGRQKIEEISHPQVLIELKSFFLDAEGGKHSIAAAEVPLLFEAGWQDMFDYTVAAETDEKTAIKRMIKNNGYSRETAEKWLKIQLPAGMKTGRADYVFNMTAGIAAVEYKVKEMLEKIKKIGKEINR